MSENKIPEGSNNAGATIGWLEKILGLKERYGFKNIVSSFLILFIAIIVGWVAFNPGSFIDRIERIQTERHTLVIERRKQIDPIVKSYLIDLRGEIDASRAFLFEAHNGGSNLNGLPFLYVDMTYDEPRHDLVRIQDEYKNISQSRFDFMETIYQNSFWFGSIEEIKAQDLELYYRLQKSNIHYLGFIVIYTNGLPTGSLGIAYDSENIPEYNEINKALHKYGNLISGLLNGTK